jgi:methylenetetrahydrofolate--tRNA-(uracil-5-)-methyltransferase
MNINFGLFPPMAESAGARKLRAERKPALAARALADLKEWVSRWRQAA